MFTLPPGLSNVIVWVAHRIFELSWAREWKVISSLHVFSVDQEAAWAGV
jgi:hypothetical protein